MSTADVAPWVAAGGGVIVAGLAGFWQSRQAKTAAAPGAQGALNDGFTALIDDLRTELARLTVEVTANRAAVRACEEKHEQAEREIAALRAEIQRLKETP